MINIVAAVAAIAYCVYRYLTPVYDDDFDDDWDDDYDFEDDPDPIAMKAAAKAASSTGCRGCEIQIGCASLPDRLRLANLRICHASKI